VPSTLTVTSIADKGAGSLRAEIAAAQSGDTIVFASSLAGQTITLKSELLINKNLTITGPGAGQLTVSGNNATRVFEVAQGMQATMSGLTISNGLAKYDKGGGILVDAGAVLNASDSTLRDNSASFFKQQLVGGLGGGIDNLGTVTLSNCILTNNTAGWFGGALDNYGTATLSNCVLTNNAGGSGAIYNHATLTVNNNTVVSGSDRAGIANTGTAIIGGCTLSNNSGSGIYNFTSGTVTVRDSQLSGNTAAEGGGIWNAGTATLSNCTLSGNSAYEYGGAIYLTSGSSGNGKLTVSGCTLSGNFIRNSGYGGGGIYITAGTATISNCTLTGNSAAGGLGGGIDVYGGFGATLTITGCTLSGNSAQLGGGIFIQSGAVMYLDAFSVANIVNNTDSSGPNGPTANIDGSYTLI
jgi:predicted outer membrane repeat protein